MSPNNGKKEYGCLTGNDQNNQSKNFSILSTERKKSTMEDICVDSISKLVAILQVIPTIWFLYTQNKEYLKIQVGWFLVSWSNDILKMLLVKWYPDASWNRRPGGTHCGMLNEPNDPRAPAFPSGHLSTASYILVSMWLEASAKSSVQTVLLVSYLVLLAWSRMKKKCHTLLQTIIGAIYGALVAVVLHRIRL